MLVRNQTRRVCLAERARVACSFFSRLRGLMFTGSLEPGAALVLEPCSSIHTCFMRYPLDALFLDEQGRVVGAAPAMVPWRLSRVYKGSRRVVELPAGTLDRTGTCPGDIITIESLDDTCNSES